MSFPVRRLLKSLLLLACTIVLGAAPAWAAEPLIAAASDLKFALEEIAGTYQKETGRSVRLTMGSSGTFATQIRNGAPFQMFLSADEDFVLKLHADGFAKDDGVLYGIGRIVLIAPPDSGLKVDGELKGLGEALRNGGIKRFAIADPEHAPYGRRAEEALRYAKLWDLIKPRLVLGENISQATQFATSGSAQGGIVALSLVMAPQMASMGRYALIPESWHQPLRQRMVLLKGADAATEAFYRYMQQPTARAIMRRYGFSLPDERN